MLIATVTKVKKSDVCGSLVFSNPVTIIMTTCTITYQVL